MLAALLFVNAGLGAAAPAGERPLARRTLTALPVGPAPACVENDGGRRLRRVVWEAEWSKAVGSGRCVVGQHPRRAGSVQSKIHATTGVQLTWCAKHEGRMSSRLLWGGWLLRSHKRRRRLISGGPPHPQRWPQGARRAVLRSPGGCLFPLRGSTGAIKGLHGRRHGKRVADGSHCAAAPRRLVLTGLSCLTHAPGGYSRPSARRTAEFGSCAQTAALLLSLEAKHWLQHGIERRRKTLGGRQLPAQHPARVACRRCIATPPPLPSPFRP